MDMWAGLGDLQAGNSALDIQSQQIPTEIYLSDHTLFRNTQRKHGGGGEKSFQSLSTPLDAQNQGEKRT